MENEYNKNFDYIAQAFDRKRHANGGVQTKG